MDWCRALFVLSIVCATAHSKALTSNDNVRKSRQLDFGECCPCPKPGAEVSSEPLYPVQPVIDDCPCRNRAADSEGSSSMLSPALKALRPFIRSQDPKTEPEPLLKPEVGLASSVLKTLQEVTNEEYEDALARDATRSVAKALESDLPLLRSEETPGSIINIILNPKETGNDLEVVPEASHLQETRCIHPLGSTHNEGSNFKPLLFRESKKNVEPGIRNSNVRSNDFDMDNQASEIQNSLQKPSNGYLMKSLESNESINSQESHVKNPTFANSVHDNLFNEQSGTSKGNTKIPDLKLSTIVDNIKKSIQSNSILNKLTKKQISTSDDGDNTPLSTVEKPQKFGSALKNLQSVFSNVEKPMPLKNLLKLKDVELVPKKEIVRDQKTKFKSAEEDDTIMNASIADFEKNSQEGNIETEILDAVPSSSIRVSNAVSKSQSTENNSCNDNIINEVPSKEPNDFEQQTHNNIKKTEQVQQELLDEVNNPSTNINLLQNVSDEQPSETPNNQKSSENDYDTSTLKSEPTIKENQSIEENPEKNIFPTIKADIIKSFNNFKKVNDDMQKKLRQNLQEVLQVVDSDKKKIVETEHLKPVKDNPKSITDDDLQKMSDSILNESNIRNKKLKPSFKQANEDNALDNCVPIRGDQHLEENSFDENPNYKSDTQSSAGNLNSTPNEQHAFSNDMNKSDISVEQNNREPVTETPGVNSNVDESGERTLDKNNEDFANSVKVSKSASDSQFANTADITSKDNNAMKEESNGKDLETEMSEINKKTSNLAANGPNESISNNEKNCFNSNDMNVQASEPIGNRVNFAKPGFNILKPESPLFPKFPLGSGLKPYSARLASPHSLDRDRINPNLSGKMNSLQSSFKNNNLKNVFKNLETGGLPTLGSNKRNNIRNSKPFHDFDSISDNFKSRADDTLQNLNNILGSGSGDLKSNHLYKNVLNNADDIRNSLSRVHYDLNDKLQKLHSDWTDKIHTIGQSADTPLPLNRAANPRKNIFDTEKRIPLLSLEKPRTETNIMKGKPKTLLNDEKFKLPHLLPKSLYKAPSLSERKSMILTTTKRPQLTTKTPPRKQVSLKSAPKPTLSQTLKDAIESAKSDKLSKMRDMKTLSSNTKPFRVRNQDYSARKSTPELRESLENQETVQPNDVAEGSRRDSVSRNSGLPFQLKAEEFSVLKKLLDGIRSSQLQSDMFRNHDDYEDNENLQAPSQNIERIQMPENTLKENVSYKCKMVCTKDDN